jgi:alkylated DNA repair dioxygenase AlkB
MTNSKHIFEDAGCVQVNSFLDPLTVSTVSKYFHNKIKRGEWGTTVSGDPTTKLAYYADPFIEVLLEAYREDVEEVCGKELLPTYSFARVYQAGEELKPHVDRPSCEISVTVSVAYNGSVSPIFMQYKDLEPSKHELSPGDAVIYKGCEATHWRAPLTQDQLTVQFMLHYVDKTGQNKVYATDKRASLGMPSTRS